jgi:hypothetical protein
MQPDLWAPTGWGSGDHSMEGILVARGPGIVPGRIEGASLVDVAPTALYLMGQPVAAAMDGKVLLAALDPALVAASPPRYKKNIAPPSGELPVGEALTAGEEAEIQARLRGLGYL